MTKTVRTLEEVEFRIASDDVFADTHQLEFLCNLLPTTLPRKSDVREKGTWLEFHPPQPFCGASGCSVAWVQLNRTRIGSGVDHYFIAFTIRRRRAIYLLNWNPHAVSIDAGLCHKSTRSTSRAFVPEGSLAINLAGVNCRNLGYPGYRFVGKINCIVEQEFDLLVFLSLKGNQLAIRFYSIEYIWVWATFKFRRINSTGLQEMTK